MLSNPYSTSSRQKCTHAIVVEETVAPSRPAMLASMLHTTAEFNALQMVVESRKFDVNGPLMFHLRLNKRDWRFVIVNLTRMVLFFDKGTDVDDPNYFLS